MEKRKITPKRTLPRETATHWQRHRRTGTRPFLFFKLDHSRHKFQRFERKIRGFGERARGCPSKNFGELHQPRGRDLFLLGNWVRLSRKNGVKLMRALKCLGNSWWGCMCTDWFAVFRPTRTAKLFTAKVEMFTRTYFGVLPAIKRNWFLFRKIRGRKKNPMTNLLWLPAAIATPTRCPRRQHTRCVPSTRCQTS